MGDPPLQAISVMGQLLSGTGNGWQHKRIAYLPAGIFRGAVEGFADMGDGVVNMPLCRQRGGQIDPHSGMIGVQFKGLAVADHGLVGASLVQQQVPQVALQFGRIRLRRMGLAITGFGCVHTTEGALAFQDYFVRLQCKPVVERIDFDGAGRAHAAPDVLAVLRRPDLRAVVICPSNPFLSVDPILALADIRAAVAASTAPVVAVSPLVGGAAVKGPTAKIFDELSIPRTARTLADHYGGLIDGLIIDRADADEAAALPIATRVVNTMMRSLEDREALAKDVLSFADGLAGENTRSADRLGRLGNG